LALICFSSAAYCEALLDALDEEICVAWDEAEIALTMRIP